MPDSQRHRPAASVSASPSGRLKKQLQRATDLEKQLGELPKSAEETAAKLRSQLCEILSDVLISDPSLALEKECAGRLWRNCFYAPIGVWRSRVSREKRKQGANLAKLELSFKKFLTEAVTLYDYLVLQYQSKLQPSNSQANSQDSSQESFRDNLASTEAVVPGLYRLYIHMGDLQRYAQSYNKAEVCYFNASKLAPGMGNPYNQLAVVAQMKDANMSCVALYWYARSLLATHDSFETSNSNLERLFSINRAYLQEHSREPTARILPAFDKKTSLELARSQKAASSKSCLAHFVDLHFDIFCASVDGIQNKMTTIVQSLDSLLQASGFGDSLLCKMVTINTFSVVVSKHNKAATSVFAGTFFFSFASCLSERLVRGLEKLVEKKGKIPPSIRLLLPLVLLCEFVDQLADARAAASETIFWKSLVDVANLVLKLSKRMNQSGKALLNPNRLKEYQLLKGFRPFSFLHDAYATQDPFVAASEAADVLDLSVTQTQDSNASGVDENKIKMSRFLEFCDRCVEKKDIPLYRTDNGYVSSEMKGERDDGDFALMENPMQDTENTFVEEQQKLSSAMEEDDAGDVVVYTAPEVGGGPALLVPGSLIAHQSKDPSPATLGTKDPVPNGHQTSRNPLASVIQEKSNPGSSISKVINGSRAVAMDVEPSEKLISPPTGIMPPPGFGIAVATPVSTPSLVPGMHGLYAQPPMPPPQGAMPPLPPNPGQLFAGGPPMGFSSPTAYSQGIPLGHSMKWFGGPSAMQTSNPFAAAPLNMNNFGAMNHNTNAGYEPEATTVDGTSLLDLGLLNSLWMDDSPGNTSKNPFATKY
jgi:hypothetical protein